MSIDTGAAAIAAGDQQAVTTLTHWIQTRGVRRASGALLEDWMKALTASGVSPIRLAVKGHADSSGGHTTQKGRSRSDAVESVVELATAALSTSERLRLVRLLLATVEVNEPPTLEHSDETYRLAVTSPRSDLDTAKQSVLDSLEVIDSTGVARILAPTGTAVRSVAQKRRAAGDLIGLPVGTRPNYWYPVFQFDPHRHKIHDVVVHANRRLYVNKDPYGAASWWLTPVDLLDGNSPLEDLEAGDLTEIAVDNVIDHARAGM